MIGLRFFAILLPLCAFAQEQGTRLNPQVQKIVAAISEERITAHLKKLESFGTRHINSAKDHPTKGIGSAQRWLHQTFSSLSPRLEVQYELFEAKRGGRVEEDVELANVIATLPGTRYRDRYLIVCAHYDTIVMKGRRQNMDGEGSSPEDNQELAPGVNDNGSGVAAILELARVLSQYEFEKTIVFIAFAAEEVGLLGSRDYAKRAKDQHHLIEAVLNNDIIGNDEAGNGRAASNVVRVFSDGPEDSKSRSVARYVKEIAERYVPSMHANLVFRADRFGRGGDHTPFHQAGFGAVRFTTASENYSHQHSITDTFENVSVPYNTRVARMNAAVLATLANAPVCPEVERDSTTSGRTRKVAMIGRGTSGYDAALRWNQPGNDDDIAGYSILIRSTTSPIWERELFIGNVTEYTVPDLSIDDIVIGIRAIDKHGNPSLVSAFATPPRVFE